MPNPTLTSSLARRWVGLNPNPNPEPTQRLARDGFRAGLGLQLHQIGIRIRVRVRIRVRARIWVRVRVWVSVGVCMPEFGNNDKLYP